MQPQKPQKIDLTVDYPCPCRRRGRLVPITLTEAFGCSRCQQIFVVEEGGYVIEQLSTGYPYKRAWRWTGHQWNTAQSGLRESYIPLLLTVALVLPITLLFLALRTANVGIILLAIVPLTLMLLPALMHWLAYRR